MAETVEVVIKIPQKVYEDCIMIPSDIKDWKDEISKAFKNGTVLSKGHGRLIDADELRKNWIFTRTEKIIIDDAPTIIEADKEVENG
jgi:hypothetical protein